MPAKNAVQFNSKWDDSCNIGMFSQMYNKVSKVMDECHIAIKLDEPTLFNMDSKRVDMEEGAYEKK